MLDKFSKEILVFNKLKSYLNESNATVIQLISPGGQSTYSLRYTDPETSKKKIIYPDAIFIMDNIIYIGEIKGGVSKSDIQKLLKLKNSIDGEDKIRSLIERITSDKPNTNEVNYLIIHSEKNSLVLEGINQLIL